MKEKVVKSAVMGLEAASVHGPGLGLGKNMSKNNALHQRLRNNGPNLD